MQYIEEIYTYDRLIIYFLKPSYNTQFTPTFVFIIERAFSRLKFFYHPVVIQTHFLYGEERQINSSLCAIVNLSPTHSDVKELFCP